eukprot:4220478-Amphidinium_carterae.2
MAIRNALDLLILMGHRIVPSYSSGTGQPAIQWNHSRLLWYSQSIRHEVNCRIPTTPITIVAKVQRMPLYFHSSQSQRTGHSKWRRTAFACGREYPQQRLRGNCGSQPETVHWADVALPPPPMLTSLQNPTTEAQRSISHAACMQTTSYELGF